MGRPVAIQAFFMPSIFVSQNTLPNAEFAIQIKRYIRNPRGNQKL